MSPTDESNLKADSGGEANDRPNFMGIPIQGWAIFGISVVAVAFAVGHFGLKLYGDYQQALSEKDALQDKADTAAKINQDTSSYSDAVTKEMDAHKNDGSGHQTVLHSDQSGKTTVTFFESDGCIAIARPGVPLPYLPEPQPILEWSLGPSKRPVPKAPDEALPSGIKATAVPQPTPTAQNEESEGRGPHIQLIRVQQELGSNQRSTPTLHRVQAGCWTNGPHPWAFRTSWGPAKGCWAPLYREWNDGCKHYQMYNTCSGQWDPRINWVSCNPQHHP